jgi:glycosyltransferase involved in cell wall biosynthesis
VPIERTPLVTIVTPCYNAEKFLPRTVESVLAQTLTDWELVIVDDGSTDQSANIATQYANQDPRVRLYQQANSYLSKARNRGFKEASLESKYLFFLDADDVLLPQALETLVDYIARQPEAGLVYCAFRCVDENDQILVGDEYDWAEPRRYEPTLIDCLGVRHMPFQSGPVPISSLSGYHLALPSCSLIKRHAFEAVGRWDEAFSTARVDSEDKDLVLRVALYSEVHFLADYLVFYRRHSHNVSQGPRLGQAFLDRKWRKLLRTLPEKKRWDICRAFVFEKYLSAVFVSRNYIASLRRCSGANIVSGGANVVRKWVSFVVRSIQWVLISAQRF